MTYVGFHGPRSSLPTSPTLKIAPSVGYSVTEAYGRGAGCAELYGPSMAHAWPSTSVELATFRIF